MAVWGGRGLWELSFSVLNGVALGRYVHIWGERGSLRERLVSKEEKEWDWNTEAAGGGGKPSFTSDGEGFLLHWKEVAGTKRSLWAGVNLFLRRKRENTLISDGPIFLDHFLTVKLETWGRDLNVVEGMTECDGSVHDHNLLPMTKEPGVVGDHWFIWSQSAICAVCVCVCVCSNSAQPPRCMQDLNILNDLTKPLWEFTSWKRRTNTNIYWMTLDMVTDVSKPQFAYLWACMLSRLSRVWLFSTLWTVAHQAPLSMGFSRHEYWSGLPFPPPENLPNQGIEPTSHMSPALAGSFFTTSATREVSSLSIKWD